MKGVMRFGKKGKLRPRYIGHYEILQRLGNVSYELKLPNDLAFVPPVFHVSMLKRCLFYPSSILLFEGLGVDENLSYKEVPINIFHRQAKRLRNVEFSTVKVLWTNHLVEGAKWEAEANMLSRYPHFFSS